MTDLDPVIQEADHPERDNGQNRKVPRPGKPDLCGDVPERISDHHATDDGQPPHGGRTGLDAMTGRTVLTDGLPDTLGPQPSQEYRGDQNTHPQGDPS